MNLKIKGFLAAALALVMLTFTTGCAQEATPYELNDAENYTVSVRYDANGGFFTTNTSVIVDSYNAAQLAGADGTASIPLLRPDDAARGNDAFTPINNGYFLAGWYTQRTETTDSQGNTIYTYAGQWDFEEDRLTVDASGTYSSAEPMLTLYAAWVPLFEVQFYSLDTGEYLASYTFDPSLTESIRLPAWDEETGATEMYQFPKMSGYTFSGAYYDPEGTQPVEGTELLHTGTVDQATGTAQDTVMKLYLDWTEGEWYHIYNVEQFLDNASVSGCYVLHADLDFEGQIWPSSLMYGNFTGCIQGNGYTMRNITLEQTNNSKVNAGLFGQLTGNAELTGVTFENVTFTIKAGTRVAGTSFGLFAGTISEGAVLEDVCVRNSTLQIDSGCYFGMDDYVIGLVCGMGNGDMVSWSDISCTAVGDDPDSLVITEENGAVTVEFVNQ